LDIVISTVGLDWDLLRMGMATAPVGFEAMGDWSQAVAKVKRLDEFSSGFAEIAALRERRARESEQNGDEISARESYLIASIYYGIAQWPIHEVNERNLELNAKKLECYAHFVKRAPHKIERVEIKVGKHVVPAWLHLPTVGKPPYPIVIMVPGLDNFKETMVWSYGDKMIERGFALLAIDGPGQAEALVRGFHITADNFGDVGPACVAWIDTRSELDNDRIGVFGRSLGSYLGTVLANSIADRIRGAVVGLACFEPAFHRLFEEGSPTFKNRMMFMSGYEDEDEFDKFVKSFDLRTRVGKLKCPLMVLGGEIDELADFKFVFEVAKKVPGPVQIVEYQNERHAPGRAPSAQLGPHWYSMMADWLTARVRDRKPMKESKYLYVKSSGEVEERPMPA
jgi:pimeloyl-ACP methyl ester carboxylesterase